MQNKFLSLLGLAKKAGKLKLGMDSTIESILENKTKSIFLTNDISENSKNKILNIVNNANQNVISIPFSKSDIEFAIGKYTAIISVLDENFAQGLNELIIKASK